MFPASGGLGWGVVVWRLQPPHMVRPPDALPQWLQFCADSLEKFGAMSNEKEERRGAGGKVSDTRRGASLDLFFVHFVRN